MTVPSGCAAVTAPMHLSTSELVSDFRVRCPFEGNSSLSMRYLMLRIPRIDTNTLRFPIRSDS
jgi:hypothetical protein